MPNSLKIPAFLASRTPVLTAAFAMAASMSPAVLAAAPMPESASPSASLQGDQKAWINDPHIHAFYALTVAAFANGPQGVDKAKFEQDSRRLFRDFGASLGMKPEAMEDHLKLIPDQVIQIATDDPKVLTSYDNFVVALMGPQ